MFKIKSTKNLLNNESFGTLKKINYSLIKFAETSKEIGNKGMMEGIMTKIVREVHPTNG